MSETYDYNLANLRREIEMGEARPAVIDSLVSKILENRDERAIGDFLSLLIDQAEYYEGMFSLIHAAESFPQESYIRSLLSTFPKLVVSAPEWASIVLMRVLNSKPAQLELVRQLRNAPSSVKQSVRDMCERINEVSPEFLSKTVPVTLATM